MTAQQASHRPVPQRVTPGIRARRLLLSLLALATLATCSAEPQLPLRVGTNVWPGYEPLYLARELGYYGDAPVRLVEFTSTSQAIHAFRNGAIDAATLTLDEALQLAQDGQPIAVVLVLDYSQGADAIVGQRAFTRLSDLAGRRVGVENTAVGAYLLARALAQSGLARDRIQVVPMPVNEHERAFREGRVDAVVTFEPVRSRLLAAGGQVLFDSSRIPGEIIDVLALRRATLERGGDTPRALLAGWFRALDYLKREPADAARRMGARQRLTPDELAAALRGLRLPDAAENRALLAASPPGLQPTLNRLAEIMLEQRLLRAPIDAGTLIDPRLLNAASP